VVGGPPTKLSVAGWFRVEFLSFFVFHGFQDFCEIFLD